MIEAGGRMQMVVTGIQGKCAERTVAGRSGKFGTVLPLLPATMGTDVVGLEGFAL